MRHDDVLAVVGVIAVELAAAVDERPTTGGNNVPVRLLAQYSDHCARSGS
jgi:hypothetical protein